MMHAAILSLSIAWADPLPASPRVAMPERSQGAVMGDGIGIGIATDPQPGGVCAPGETLFGIDVSYYQGDIDWNAVAADGVEYAIVRVSHSLQFFDTQFEANLAGSRAAGIHTGVYQYFEPDEDPIAQAQLLLDSMGPLLPGDLPPMIDVESTGGLGPAEINNAIHAWIDHVEAALGVKPIIYSGYYFWNDNVGSADFGEYPLMVAWYGVECPGGVPTGWDMWTFHQYCDCGSVAGIGGNVDVDRFNGSIADLEALSFAPVCGDGTCSGAETPYTCEGDCPPCGVIAANGATLDNGDACYALYGDAAYWREEAQGEGGSLVWTYATNFDQTFNYAVWQLHFQEAARYDLEVHIPQPFGQSKQATYQVRHAGGDTPVSIDQSVNNGWVSLGEFDFNAASDHSVRLDDNTGEDPAANVQLVFDAIRVTRLDLDPSSTGNADDDDSGPGDESGEDDGLPGEDSDPGDDTAGVGDTEQQDTGNALPPTGGLEEKAEGCGCRTDDGLGGSGRGWLIALGLLALPRSRRGRAIGRSAADRSLDLL